MGKYVEKTGAVATPSELGTGTPDNTTFLRGDGAWAVPGGGGGGGSHAASHQNNGADEISVAGLSGLLADPQTPASHTHAQSEVTNLISDLGNKCSSTDPRLSDARTPLGHTHPQSDVTGLVAALAAKEPGLGNPSQNGDMLVSTTGGVRSWAAPPSGGGLWTRVVLSADRTNNNAVANTLADVTGLSFPVTAGLRYWFRFYIVYTAQATTTGSRWTVNGPAFTGLSYMSEYSLTGTTTTRNAQVIAYNSPAGSNATSASTGPNNIAQIEGFIQPSANGTLIARFASEVANSAIVAKVGSFVEYTQV